MASGKLSMSLDEVKAYIEKDPEGALLIAEAHFGLKPDYTVKDEAGVVVTKETANQAVFHAVLKEMEKEGQLEKDSSGKKPKKAPKDKKSESGGTAEKKDRPRRGQVDYSTMESPYRPGCSQGVIFDLLKTNKIKADEVKDRALEALTAVGKTTKNIGVLVTASINDAKRRGWTFEEKEGLIVVGRVTPESAKV